MPFGLLKGVEALLADGLKEVRFRVPGTGEAYAPAQIFLGELPPKKQGQIDFPYVILQAVSGSDQDENSDITVKILCGIYSAEGVEAGVNDILNLITRCRKIVLSKRLTKDSRYSLKLPVTWECGDPEAKYFQPQPHAEGEVTTVWETSGIRQTLTEEVEACL